MFGRRVFAALNVEAHRDGDGGVKVRRGHGFLGDACAGGVGLSVHKSASDSVAGKPPRKHVGMVAALIVGERPVSVIITTRVLSKSPR